MGRLQQRGAIAGPQIHTQADSLAGDPSPGTCARVRVSVLSWPRFKRAAHALDMIRTLPDAVDHQFG